MSLMLRRKHKKGQGGFTLVELLIVVAILGILAGIVTLSLIGLTGTASKQACAQELSTVQSAMDAYMASNNVTNALPTPASTAGTQDMGTPVPLYNANPNPNASPTPTASYTRTAKTHGFYTWTSSGTVTQVSCS